jgi:hypothetical protein|tara:strand:- start:5613 stop:7406 length:1794 start_codon:yes stop_codon:yes gene_type:complete
MALKDLVTDLGSFYENNPFAAKFKTKAGPTYAQKSGFNQRSFRYGDDRPDGGSSKQPFIKSILPDVNSEPTSATGLLAGLTRQVAARVDDLERIGRFLITTKGLQFIAKQNILSAQNPIVPGKPNRSKPLRGFYNPLNTLAQVAASGTGIHLEKQGLLPIGFNDDQVKYEKAYLNDYSASKNKLLMLHASKLSIQGAKANTQNPNLEDFGISTDFQQLFNYPGGPGILKTIIPFASNRVYNGQEKTQYSLYSQDAFTYTQDQLQAYGGIPDLPSNLITTDFRRNIPVIEGNPNQKSTGPFGENATRDYTDITVNKITRVGIGDPGKKSRDRSHLYKTDFDTIDKINALPLYEGGVADLKSHSRDFIRFRFEVIDNNKTSSSTYVHFRAFLGEITDTFGGTWNPTNFVGRGDTFYNYTGFTRGISLSFKVHPQSRDEMKAIYQKLTYLASTLAPDYSGGGGYMKGNITKLTIGSYFYRIPGFIGNLTYTVPEDAAWEIAFDSPEQGNEIDQMEVPKHFNVSLQFTPIHNFAPQLMDGTREYALFTPDQKNKMQKNRYLPPKTDNVFRNKQKEVVRTDKKGDAIAANAEAANEVVNMIK